MIKKLNKWGKGKFVMIFDFSTLYTRMSHSKLFKLLYELTNFCLIENHINTSVYISLEQTGSLNQIVILLINIILKKYKVCLE